MTETQDVPMFHPYPDFEIDGYHFYCRPEPVGSRPDIIYWNFRHIENGFEFTGRMAVSVEFIVLYKGDWRVANAERAKRWVRGEMLARIAAVNEAATD